MIEENVLPQTPINQPRQEIPKKKNILVLYLLSLVVVAIVSGGGVYLWQKSILSKQEVLLKQTVIPTMMDVQENIPTISDEQTADWKIYKNEKYSFELKYPTSWKIDNEDKNTGSVNWIASEPGPWVLSLKKEDRNNKTIEEFIKRDQFPYEVIKRINNSLIVSDPITEGSGVYVGFVVNGDYVYSLTLSYDPPKLDEDPISLFEKILSTLKFGL